MFDLPGFGDAADGDGKVPMALARKFAIRFAVDVINKLVSDLESVELIGDDVFKKVASKGVQTAIQHAEEIGSALRQLDQ